MRGEFKILILTTNTTHHSYFVKSIKEKFNGVFVIYEEKKIKFSHSTNHSLEEEQILFEKNKWFSNVDFSLKKIDDIEFVHDINSSETKKIICFISKGLW